MLYMVPWNNNNTLLSISVIVKYVEKLMFNRLTHESYLINSVDAAIFMIPDAGNFTERSCDQKTVSSLIPFILFQFCYIAKHISVMQKICKAFLEVMVHSYDNKYKFFLHFVILSWCKRLRR